MIKKHAGTLKTNPEISIGIRNQASNTTDRRSVRNRLLKQVEAGTVKADETSLGADPQIAIVRSSDCVNRAAKESSLFSPLVMDVLWDSPGRIH
jgi:hypothetical protein